MIPIVPKVFDQQHPFLAKAADNDVLFEKPKTNELELLLKDEGKGFGGSSPGHWRTQGETAAER